MGEKGLSKSRRQCAREVASGNLFAPARILTAPKGGEITRAVAFGGGAQGGNGGGRQGKGRRSRVDGTQLAEDAVDDAAGGPPGKEVGDGGVMRLLTLDRSSMDLAGGCFRTKEIGSSHLHTRRAQCQR